MANNTLLDQEAPSGIAWNPHSEYAKEMRKWEAYPSAFGPAGKPRKFEAYPTMLYKAFKNEHGKVLCGDTAPLFATPEQIMKADVFTRQCQKIAETEEAHRLSRGQGWCDSPAEAIEQFEREEQAVGNAAAEAAYAVHHMTAPARAEYAAADRATGKHVVDVQPKRKRGRPAKGTVAVTSTGPVQD